MSAAVACVVAAGAAAAGAALELARAEARPGRRGAHPRVNRPPRSAVPIVLALGRRLGVRRAASDLDRRIVAAGSPLGLAAADVVALKAGGALIAALAALPLALAGSGRGAVVLIAAACAAGFLAPDAWLRRRARTRALAMARELPDVLDLLRVTVDAGLPVGRALSEVGRRHAGVLAQELAATATAIELGVPRAGALAALPQRAPLPAVAALVAAVERSERHGAPLAPALVALAGQARAERARAVAEQAARAAPKIQLAVALLLVPSVLALVAAAAVAALVPH